MSERTLSQPTSSHRSKRKLIAMIALSMLGCLMIFSSFAVRRVRANAAQRVFTVAQSPHKTVALVLGARVYEGGQPAPPLEDRLHCALSLYRAGKVEYVLVSGDHGREGYDEVNAMHAWLVQRGVPTEKIYLDHAGFRTLDSMVRARQVFSVRSMAICTQRFHLDRSLWLAAANGIDAVGVIADTRIYPQRRRDVVREWFAQTRAFLDTEVFATRPRFGGTPMPIGVVSALLTHDQHTHASP